MRMQRGLHAAFESGGDGRGKPKFSSKIERNLWVLSLKDAKVSISTIAAILGVSVATAQEYYCQGKINLIMLNRFDWYVEFSTGLANALLRAGYTTREQIYLAIENGEITNNPKIVKFSSTPLRQKMIPGVGKKHYSELRQWVEAQRDYLQPLFKVNADSEIEAIWTDGIAPSVRSHLIHKFRYQVHTDNTGHAISFYESKCRIIVTNIIDSDPSLIERSTRCKKCFKYVRDSHAHKDLP